MCKAHSFDLGTIRRRSSTGRRLSRIVLDSQGCPLKGVGDVEGQARILVTLSMTFLVRYLFKLDGKSTEFRHFAHEILYWR